MKTKQRERWETKTLQKIRTHLQKNLAILTYTSTEDKKDIESRVMANVQEAVASISDYTVERGSEIPSFESQADLLAMYILRERQCQREFD